VSRRAEFTKRTKREALKRAGGKCEASGTLYGLEPGQRCGADLAYGLEFDHAILEANSHDNSLANCVCACIRCHRWKTRHTDIPTAAKTVRQRDKHAGITNPRRPWAKRQPWTPRSRDINDP
jgi:HNH endonuclease